MRIYVKAAFHNADQVPFWLKQDKGALSALSRYGIDLYNADFSVDRTGKKADDVVIYCLVPNENFPDRYVVWIPGIYNDDDYITDPRSRNYKQIKYIPKKNLPIRDVIYINKASNEKQWKDRYRDPRYKYKYSRYDMHGKYAGQYYNKPWSGYDGEEHPGYWSNEGLSERYGEKRDKSGYVIPDPKEKLAEFYSSDAGAQKLAERIQKAYDDLIQLKTDLFNIDFKTYGDDYYSTDYRNVLGRFGDACIEYRHLLKEASDSRDNEYTRRSSFSTLRDLESMIKEVRRAVDSGRYR